MTSGLTVLLVEQDDHLSLLGARQGLQKVRLGSVGRQGAVQEVTSARTLHDLEALVLDGITESVIAVDDRFLGYLSVGDQKLAVLRWKIDRANPKLLPQDQGSSP